MRKFLMILLTMAGMVVTGLGAYLATIMLLMALGTKYHGNYEYFGQTPAAPLVFVAGGLGFLVPGIAARYFFIRHCEQTPWRFSLRALLIVTTVVALALGVADGPAELGLYRPPGQLERARRLLYTERFSQISHWPPARSVRHDDR
jgi:hypothetical protein